MIKINERCKGANHDLIANVNLPGWKKGEMKENVWVMMMSDGRVAVMGRFFPPDNYYQVFDNIYVVHKTFNEQLDIESR